MLSHGRPLEMFVRTMDPFRQTETLAGNWAVAAKAAPPSGGLADGAAREAGAAAA